MLPKAVFFDRDGVLNVDSGYVHCPKDFQWIDGAEEAIAYLNSRHWLVIVVTNQSGVARGYYTEKDVQNLHQYMNDMLKKKGGWIDAFYYCPYLKGATIPEYDRDSEDRKPRPGMILKGLKKYNVPLSRAFLYGDGERDIEAAHRAGIQGFLFSSHNLFDFVKSTLPKIKD